VIQTGVSFVIFIDFNTFKELFQASKTKKNKQKK